MHNQPDSFIGSYRNEFESKLKIALEEAEILIGASMLDENLKEQCRKILDNLEERVKSSPRQQVHMDDMVRTAVIELLNLLDDHSDNSEQSQLFKSLRDLLWTTTE